MARLTMQYAGVLGPLVNAPCPASSFGGHSLTPIVSYRWKGWRPRKAWYLLCIYCDTTSDPISSPEACVSLLNAINNAYRIDHTEFPAHLVDPNAPFGNTGCPA